MWSPGASSRRVPQRRGQILNHRRGTPPSPTRSSAIFSRQSVLVLAVGIMFGYVLLPMILLEMDIDAIMDTLPKVDNKNVPWSSGTGGPSYPASSNYLRPVASDALAMSPRTLETTGSKPNFSEVEKRIVEDRDVLARQSLPTATTPYIMKTQILPDHHRMKILVTGGAGFVGSHLVVKLMMEGHEVIVVDNFFTGQKKNIAHWLMHPNFR